MRADIKLIRFVSTKSIHLTDVPCEVAVSQCSCKFLSLSSLAIAAVLDDKTLLKSPSAGVTDAACKIGREEHSLLSY